ncbi:BRISC and BRCA1-A complex member 2 isoform X2 [Narcine bancroftii]|uniref:BRISC and BRCA1-A complex member 2 isoform X2 n=1 Tax=Narcine bancroftii TaxID=1343680 RepID=UPI0038312DBD
MEESSTQERRNTHIIQVRSHQHLVQLQHEIPTLVLSAPTNESDTPSIRDQTRDIIFNCHYPDLPPDFIFGEDIDFLPEPTMLHHLNGWNSQNPDSLLLVIKELVQQYHKYQCDRLHESSRLMFEYTALQEGHEFGDNMEIYAGRKNNWTGEFSARFLLKLPVDFSNIPTYLLKDTSVDPGEDVALLSVSFEDAEATQVFPKLYLSPRIEHALGGTSALHIPPFPSGGCLIDYVPQVCQLLTNKVQYIIQGYHRRREYIAAFLSHFGTGVVEYDAEGFTKLILLLIWKDFCFLVHIIVTANFPGVLAHQEPWCVAANYSTVAPPCCFTCQRITTWAASSRISSKSTKSRRMSSGICSRRIFSGVQFLVLPICRNSTWPARNKKSHGCT